MLSKADYLQHIDQMLEIEKTMEVLYADYAAQVDDKELKELFLKISHEEKGHSRIVDEIKQLLLDLSAH